MNDSQVEIVELEEKHFVGIAVTVSFQRHDPERIREASQLFYARRKEISGIVNEQQYVCPHFANDLLFTYIYSMEVSEVRDIPKGMIGFSIPSQKYAKVRTKDQDPYKLIKTYLRDNGFENNERSVALEIFKFGEDQHVNHADIFVPIK
ncbi:GyrI-like domain-containing protein [Paenibacillus sp.]|uniref:GyrI-like domain-containing protein n=1 Tax=Paenibacillus sp. TaxID=58172 RepID=UPI002D285F06|nr:GyrI-like domain-containing protein [Paenibacillus sp.]HZG86696.1 GyrI-like domain-containing protein [Paenibacillus sp.]